MESNSDTPIDTAQVTHCDNDGTEEHRRADTSNNRVLIELVSKLSSTVQSLQENVSSLTQKVINIGNSRDNPVPLSQLSSAHTKGFSTTNQR